VSERRQSLLWHLSRTQAMKDSSYSAKWDKNNKVHFGIFSERRRWRLSSTAPWSDFIIKTKNAPHLSAFLFFSPNVFGLRSDK
jgi:hypothetical protein